MSGKHQNKFGMGCLVLFALPFAAVGVVMTVLTVRSLLYWLKVQEWAETPCTIVEASLKESTDEDGTTYRAVARYKYQWAGREYECDVVGVHGGSDNLGKFQRNKAAELMKYQQSGKPFRCFVNPNDPSEALLYRDLRVGMLAFKAMFGVVFGGVGFGLLVAGIWGAKTVRQEKQLRELHPAEPWKTRKDWASGRIRSSRWGPVVGMAFFSLIWNAISWTVAAAFFFGDEDMPIWVVAICLGFPVIGLIMLGYTVYLAIGATRWSGSELELATLPGVVGGRLAGVIHAPAGLELAESFLLTLTCFQKKTRSTSDGTETYEDAVWQADQEIVKTLGGEHAGKTVIPVGFTIPYEQHPTDEDAGFLWRLEVQAEMPGVDYRASFEVPVFKTEESSAEPPADESLLEEYVAAPSFESAVSRAGGRLLSQTGYRSELVFPMGRNLGLALVITVFAAIWTGISVGLLYSDAPLLFKIVFPASDLLVLAMAAWMWLEKTSLSFGADGVDVQGGLLGMGKHRHFEPGQIKKVVAEPSGTRSGATVYQQVTLMTKIGDAEKLVSGIRRRSDAETIAAKIEELVGIARAGSADKRQEPESGISLEIPLSEE